MSETLRSKFVKTRKKHHCFGCLKKIEKGETVKSSVFTDMGKIYTSYLCDICDEIVSNLEYGDFFCEGELLTTPEYEELTNKLSTTSVNT